MAVHTKRARELMASNHDQHIDKFVQKAGDWEINESAVVVSGACVTVCSPVTVYWNPERGTVQHIIIGVYLGEKLVSIAVINPGTGEFED